MIKPTTTSKVNKPLPVLEFERFQDDNNIFVFEILDEYILLAKPWREKLNHTQLLLSHIESSIPQSKHVHCLSRFVKFLHSWHKP